MIATPDLINSLAMDLVPVRRLRAPIVRCGYWLLFSLFVIGMIALGYGGVRSDLSQRMEEPTFAIGLAAALLTGVLAALAAFLVSLPDRSNIWLLLPVPTLAVWLSTIGYGCLTNWVELDANRALLGAAARCFATLVLTSVPLSFALLVMLKHAASLRLNSVTLIGGLSVASLTASALSIFHDLDATVMILIWNVGVVVLILGLGSIFGRKMFSWVSPRAI